MHSSSIGHPTKVDPWNVTKEVYKPKWVMHSWMGRDSLQAEYQLDGEEGFMYLDDYFSKEKHLKNSKQTPTKCG
jgi:hypothetical protein